MTTNLGSYNTSGTRTHVRFQFSTHAAAGGNVAPLSAFEAADLRIYRAADGAAFSATQRSSSNGVTMTSPFDSLTGYHDVDIDLTDNTDAGFYAAGYFYIVTLAPDTETIDGQTITGVPLACFEIGQQVNVTHINFIPATSVSSISAYIGSTGEAVNGTNVNTLAGHDPGEAIMGTTDLDATLATLATYVDTEVAAIKAKTDNLPSDPADASDVAGAFSTLTSHGDSAWATATSVAVSDKTGFKLASDGIDLILVESGISAGAGLTDDAGTQLTSINLRQGVALALTALAGTVSGGGTSEITFKQTAKPSGQTRILAATSDASGNRPTLTLKVPT